MNLKKKKVIVTGGSGFIGTEVVLQLLNKNYQVKIIDLKKPQVTHKNLSFKKYDLRTSSHLTALFKGWDYVLHLAAEVGGVTYNNENPATILRHNVLIDTHTIEAAFCAKVHRFVYISSSLVYEKTTVLPYVENDTLLLPDLTYGIGKLFGERLCIAYGSQHKFSFTICRLFNAYGYNCAGGGDPNGHVIPELVKKIYSGVYPIPIFGTGEQTRSFTHVRDLASGIIASMESKKGENEIFNIASNKEVSIKKILEILWRKVKKEKPLKIKYIKSHKHDVLRSYAEVKKMRKIIGWEATITLDKGLAEYIE